MAYMTETWHKDKEGFVRPDRYVGKKYFHPKTGKLYEVVGFGIDSQRELWLVHYRQTASTVDGFEGFTFTHTIAEFIREGRFLEVKP